MERKKEENKVKVLHVSRTMGQGGAEKVVYQLCKDNKIANQMVVSCGGKYVKKLEQLGVQHFTIPDIEKKNPIVILKTFLIINKLIRDETIEIIHSHHRMAAFYARLLQLFNRDLKHVYTAHNVFYGKRKLMRFALNKATIVACGNTVKNNLINEYGIKEKCIKVIYNSIEPTKIKDISIPELSKRKQEGSCVVGSIGRISEQKGFDTFVKAIGLCAKNGIPVTGVIIGDGEDAIKIRKLTRELGIDREVIFLGYCDDVISTIAKMDFIVLASRWEGFPLTPIESFYVGKTIIVSDIENNLEIVEPGKNGLSFPVDDYEKLAEKITLLIEDNNTRKKLETCAKTTYFSKFDYHLFIEGYANIYEKMEDSMTESTI